MVFILSALWWIRIIGLWKLPDGREWLWGKLGLILMGGAMLSKSLIQLSVDGWGCVLFLLFDLRQTVVGVILVMVTFKRTCAHNVVFSDWTPQQATVNPRLHQRLLDTRREVWVSLLWGHCSCLLASGVHKVLYFVYTNKHLLQICFLSRGSSAIKSHWPPKRIPWGLLVPLPDPQVGKSIVGPRTFLTVWEFLWYNCSAVCGSSA